MNKALTQTKKAQLPTKFGDFNVIGFNEQKTDKCHLAIIKGKIENQDNVPVRIHSQCLTGDALGSIRCDCRDQLTLALEKIEQNGLGIVLYMRQEGRGIGLANKLKAYRLQDEGKDTVEANKELGFKEDHRDYTTTADILDKLKVNSIKLMTNNPNKVEEISKLGIDVIERIPHQVEPTKANKDYLKTKKEKLGHDIDNN